MTHKPSVPTDAQPRNPIWVSGLFLLAIANAFMLPLPLTKRLFAYTAAISASQNHILGASHSAYSARRGGGNCRHGAGRCSAAQTESLAPCKIGPRNSLVLKRSDFAAMEKVRENARISLFSASFYCGKEAKTLAKTSFRAVFSIGRMHFLTSCAVPMESVL